MTTSSNWLMRASWAIMTLLCLFLAATTLIYFSFRTDVNFLLVKQDVAFDPIWRIAFYIHISSSLLVIAVGPFQFIPALRKQNIALHRTLGKLYVFNILLLAAPSGLYMAYFANGGFWAATGFFILSWLWFLSTYQAYKAIIDHKLTLHQHWMVHSFALSFSAVTLRLWVPILSLGFGVDPDLTVILTAWINWIPNVILAEILWRKLAKSI
jgi:uncharacterized membrane protein